MKNCVLIGIALLICSTAALAADYPRLLWRVSDEDLEAPLGAVQDVAVDAARTIYLLDGQVKEVRRIAIDGTELPPLGREGEGPGEFSIPMLIAAIPAGGFVVVQDFHLPAVCLTSDGQLCAAPDLQVIREPFGMTSFLPTTRIDGNGRLYVAALTTERPYDRLRPDADLGNAMSVFALRRGDTQPAVLFTDSKILGDQHTVRFPHDHGFYSLRSWDVDSDGRVIYADPSGKYSVLIGHPASGKSSQLDLPPAPRDEDAIKARVRSASSTLETYPRIVDVQWIAKGQFLVKPTAAITEKKTLPPGGVMEIFDIQGRSLGRRAVTHDFNPEQDSLFLRGNTMVIVRGGVSSLKASFMVESKPNAAEYEAIVVEVYDLTPQ